MHEQKDQDLTSHPNILPSVCYSFYSGLELVRNDINRSVCELKIFYYHFFLAPETILKEYEVFASICHGGSANVYAARRISDGMPVGN